MVLTTIHCGLLTPADHVCFQQLACQKQAGRWIDRRVDLWYFFAKRNSKSTKPVDPLHVISRGISRFLASPTLRLVLPSPITPQSSSGFSSLLGGTGPIVRKRCYRLYGASCPTYVKLFAETESVWTVQFPWMLFWVLSAAYPSQVPCRIRAKNLFLELANPIWTHKIPSVALWLALCTVHGFQGK